jgi:hypothetical protein
MKSRNFDRSALKEHSMRKGKVSKGLLICLAILAGVCFSTTNVFAKEANSTSAFAAHPNNYTIEWMDASGHITKTWQGSPADAEKIKTEERAKFQRAKRDINPVGNCVFPNDFFDVYNQTVYCFANAGTIGVTYPHVYEVDSGHNHGSFSWCPDTDQGCFHTVPVDVLIDWETSIFMNTTVTVRRITIE